MNKYLAKMESLSYYYVWGNNSSKNNTAEKIDFFEQLIGNKLPLNYKNFLLNYNCISFDEYVVFPFAETYPKGDVSMINVFFGFLPEDTYDLAKNYNNYRGRMPSDLIPIASDPGGNILCIAVSEDSNEKVFFWDHENEEVFENGSCTNQNIYLVAKSFDEFIDSLEFFIDEDD